jgi:hypothetical protein
MLGVILRGRMRSEDALERLWTENLVYDTDITKETGRNT